jgi:hypothetical protein
VNLDKERASTAFRYKCIFSQVRTYVLIAFCSYLTFWDPTALEVLLVRTVLLTVARWFVLGAREAIDNFLQVWAAWRGIIPYFLVWIFLRWLTREFSDMRNAREWGKWQMNDLSFDAVPPRPYIIDRGALHAHMMTMYP